ncbi:MAG: arsenite methyltransferase [Phycisphaerales bacterium]|nr:arsenite methyltransferase [Phycisphaerales bacterium]
MQNGVNPAEWVREQVREGYGRIAEAGAALGPADGAEVEHAARGAGGCCDAACCGGWAAKGSTEFARGIGYEASDLSALPEGANLGLSCGNPTAIAALRPGEVVLDLGSGAGFDCFIAGPKVGATGRVIGVDMTAQMIDRARRNLSAYTQRTGLKNVEFRLGEIEHLPVADGAVDVVISNCVLNLSPDKPQVWREIARVLRPGGRVAVSDLALLKPLPEAIRRMVEALVGCVAGAAPVEETRRQMQTAGFCDIRLTPKSLGVKSTNELQDPLYRKIAAHLPAGTTPGDYITSLDIAARKA